MKKLLFEDLRIDEDLFYELDKEKIIKELGDVAWYIAEIATVLEVDLEEVLIQNIEKLKKRYPEGFDIEKSLHREAE